MTDPLLSRSMGEDDLSKLTQIALLHDDAFDAAMTIDGHCKSSDGQITVHLTNHTERVAGEPALAVTGVEIYAYVVGPSRSHHFDSVDEALAAVKDWHAQTMAWVKDERADAEAEAERRAESAAKTESHSSEEAT